jgi:hypothetical protein
VGTIGVQPEIRLFIAGGAWYLGYTSGTEVTSARARATVYRADAEVSNRTVRFKDAAFTAIAA